MPEVGIRGRKLDSDTGLSIAFALDGDNPGLYVTVGTFVDEQERLPHNHELIHMNERPIPVNGLRMGASAEFFSLVGLAVYCKRNG